MIFSYNWANRSYIFQGENMATSQRTSQATGKKTATTKTNTMPKRVLNAWLKKREGWSHDEWLALLDELRAKGHQQLVDEKADEIGFYLESNRH